jgi:hypothetical protein
MSHKFLLNSSFHAILIAIDRELAEVTRKNACTCGGKLHQSNYPRSPFGIPAEFRRNYDERLSFCCADCRKRVTPPSVRFFGRRWYPSPLLVLVSVLMRGINDCRLKQIKRHFGITVSESTWKRWRRWWREAFVKIPFWKQAQGIIPPNNRFISMPRNLLYAFKGAIEEKIILLLKFLSPITASDLRAV